MNLEVRRVKGGEWPQYRKLRLEALKDAPLAFEEQYAESLAQSNEFWRERVHDCSSGSACSMFVAVHQEEFVGKASCFVEDDVAEYVSTQIVGLYVTPQARGRGVAQELLTATIRWARKEAHADRIRLFVVQPNDAAARLYRKSGFVYTGATIPYGPDPLRAEEEMVYQGNG